MRKPRFECQSQLSLTLAIGALALAVGCGDEKPNLKEGFANLRAINLAEGAPELDIVLNGSPETFQGIDFSDSSDYQAIAIGSYTLEVRAPGDIVILTTNITLENLQSYTFVIHDRVDSVRGELFQDDFNIPDGEIKIRLFNVAVGRGPMALYFVPEDNSAPQKLTDAVDYGQASAPVSHPDGNHNVAIDMNLDGVVDATYDLPPLSDGTLANVFAVIDSNGELDLVLQMNDGFTWDLDGEGAVGVQARARVIHLIPNAPTLSIFTAGATVTSDLSFMEQSGYVGVPAGTYDIDVGESVTSPLFTLQGATFETSQNYTIVLFGNAGMPTGRTIVDDTANIETDRTRVRLIHTAADVGELDFWDANPAGEPVLLFGDLDFGEAGDPIDVVPGSYRIGVDVNNDNIFDVFFQTPALPAGQLVNIYAVMDNGTPRLVTQMDSSIMAIGTTP